jgi:hypothetical protein
VSTKPAELRNLPPTIRIERRFCGPPDSSNGGYVSGRLARYIAGSALVRLEVPPPLDAEMQVKESGTSFELVHGATVVARARPAVMSLDIPAAPTFAEAEAASKAYRGFRAHPFPTCFVCGPERAAGDGLRIFAGPLRNGVVGSPWVPDATLGDGKGRVRVSSCGPRSIVRGRSPSSSPTRLPCCWASSGRRCAARLRSASATSLSAGSLPATAAAISRARRSFPNRESAAPSGARPGLKYPTNRSRR